MLTNVKIYILFLHIPCLLLWVISVHKVNLILGYTHYSSLKMNILLCWVLKQTCQQISMWGIYKFQLIHINYDYEIRQENMYMWITYKSAGQCSALIESYLNQVIPTMGSRASKSIENHFNFLNNFRHTCLRELILSQEIALK